MARGCLWFDQLHWKLWNSFSHCERATKMHRRICFNAFMAFLALILQTWQRIQSCVSPYGSILDVKGSNTITLKKLLHWTASAEVSVQRENIVLGSCFCCSDSFERLPSKTDVFFLFKLDCKSFTGHSHPVTNGQVMLHNTHQPHLT